MSYSKSIFGLLLDSDFSYSYHFAEEKLFLQVYDNLNSLKSWFSFYQVIWLEHRKILATSENYNIKKISKNRNEFFAAVTVV